MYPAATLNKRKSQSTSGSLAFTTVPGQLKEHIPLKFNPKYFQDKEIVYPDLP